MRQTKQKQDRLRIWKDKRLRIVVFALLGIFLLFTYKKAAVYLGFVALTAVITYYSKLYHLPFDVTPLFFLEIVITRYYGYEYMLLFILIAYIIPKVVAGSGMNWMSYAFISVSLLANALSLMLTGLSLQTVGYITSVIQYIGGIFVGMVGRPFYIAASDGIANVTNNLLWFLIFSDVVVFLLK